MEIAIDREIVGSRLDPYIIHEEMKKIYTWADIARRTERVYDTIAEDDLSSCLVDRAMRLVILYFRTIFLPHFLSKIGSSFTTFSVVLFIGALRFASQAIQFFVPYRNKRKERKISHLCP